MWRALFLAVGIYCCLVGVKAIAIEKAILQAQRGEPASRQQPARHPSRGTTGQIEVAPPDWLPWSIMAFGVVVILYTFSLPKRIRG